MLTENKADCHLIDSRTQITKENLKKGHCAEAGAGLCTPQRSRQSSGRAQRGFCAKITLKGGSGKNGARMSEGTGIATFATKD